MVPRHQTKGVWPKGVIADNDDPWGNRGLASNQVLIVDDEPNIVESLRFIFERAGYGVKSVSDGLTALDCVRRDSFCAVVLDLMMPGLNGFEVLRAIKQDGQLSGLPVVVLTAKGQSRDRRAAEEIGADAFITKPYSNAEVVSKIEELAAR